MKLQERNQKLAEKAEKIAQEKPLARAQKGYISSKYFLGNLREKIAKILQKKFPEISEGEIVISPVPEKFEADFALRIPLLMKDIKKYNTETLPQIQQILDPENIGLSKTTLAPPYLNLSLNYNHFAENILTDIQNLKERYGENNHFEKQKAIIEFSDPNIAKTFHIGHLRSTIQGQVLCNLYEKCGYTIFAINHIGDWGTQFGKVSVAYEKWGDGNIEKSATPVEDLADLYVRFSQESKNDLDLIEQARDYFNQLENGDEKLMQYWEIFRKVSLKELDEIYKRMNIYFDITLGESFYEDKMDKVVQECLDKGFAKKNEVAVSVDLGGKIPSFLILKSNGGTNYATRDMATVFYREKTFRPQKHIYVVGSEQKLHFRQFLTLSERMKYIKENQAEYIEIGTMKEKGKKISSREGAGGFINLLNRVVEKAHENMAERDFNEEEKKEVAEKIALGALFYNDLQNGHAKDVDFDLERILSMKGKSAPYICYALVRGKSILKKFGEAGEFSWNVENDLEKIEKKLLRILSDFPSVILKSCQSNSSHHLALYLNELAQAFNTFHHDVHVGNSQGNIQEFRKFLVSSVVQVLKNGLNILNIPIPERM